MTIHLDMTPPSVTHQGGGKRMNRRTGAFFGNPAYEAAKQETILKLKRYLRREAFTGPVAITVLWVRPWRTSEAAKRRKGGLLPCTTKPDLDNMNKMLMDCLTELEFLQDDAQVSQLLLSKAWGDTPGIWIHVREIEPVTFATKWRNWIKSLFTS